MDLNYTGVNWLAVVIAAVANIVIGFIWYAPQVYGKQWSTLVGRPLPSPGQIAPMTYVGGIVVALVVAYVLAVISGGLGAATLTDGAIVGFLAWLGFVATTGFGTVLWEGRPMNYWFINAGQALVSLVVMGAIIGYFG